jgi:hypothetical protein
MPGDVAAAVVGSGRGRHLSDRRELFELRKQFPPRGYPASWEATVASRGRVLARVLAAPFAVENDGYQAEVRRGVCAVLDWLAAIPGKSWQARWGASGAEQAADWRVLAATPTAAGRTDTAISNLQNRCSRGLAVLICADVIRPSFGWLLSTPSPKNLAAAMARSRDPKGFAALNDLCRKLATGDTTRQIALARIAMIMAAKGGWVSDITVGDCMEMVQIAAEVTKATGRDRGYRSSFFYQLVRSLGRFPDNAPVSTRAFHVFGQMSIKEMVDRYGIECRPIHDLLVDYLREFQVSSDYTTVLQLSYVLSKLFWRDLELHHPGIDSLHFSTEVAAAWKQRILVKTTTTVENGEIVEHHAPRLSAIQHMGTVRTFYLDIAQWAADDPSRWGPWVAVCPIRDGELTSGRSKTAAARKSRMDQRTRERLPVLPTLIAAAENRRTSASRMLAAALAADPGQEFTVDGQVLRRAERTPETGSHLWAEDSATGRRRDLKTEERRAFWAWAAVEVLRLTGIRIEELTELNHHSLIQYRLPTTRELVPLLQIAPSKTDAERILVISPELADVLATIVTRIREPGGGIPPGRGLRLQRKGVEPADATAVPMALAPGRPAAEPCRHPPPDQRHTGRHRTDRQQRQPAEVHPTRLPKVVHHRRDHARHAAPHRATRRRSPRHQHHHGLQGRLPRGSHQRPSGVHHAPSRPAPQRGVPHTNRRGMGGVPRPLRAAACRPRRMRPILFDPLYPRAQLLTVQSPSA